jgi:hypothetical protein
MAMTDQVLLADSLTSNSTTTTLSLGLPWFRSLPWGAVANLQVGIDDLVFDSSQIHVQPEPNGSWVALDTLAGDSREWFVQDRKEFQIQAPTPTGSHSVRATFQLVMPNLMVNPTQPISFPSIVVKELTVQ